MGRGLTVSVCFTVFPRMFEQNLVPFSRNFQTSTKGGRRVAFECMWKAGKLLSSLTNSSVFLTEIEMERFVLWSFRTHFYFNPI